MAHITLILQQNIELLALFMDCCARWVPMHRQLFSLSALRREFNIQATSKLDYATGSADARALLLQMEEAPLHYALVIFWQLEFIRV